MNLNSLPPELLIKILSSFPNLSSIPSIILTCSLFSSLWKSHSTIICQNILLNSPPPCLNQLHGLAYLQESNHPHRNFSTKSHAKRVLLMSQLATRASDIFISEIAAAVPGRDQNPHLSATEHKRFHECFNGIWTALHHVVSAQHPSKPTIQTLLAANLPPYLSSFPLLTIYRLSEIALWIRAYTSPTHRSELRAQMMMPFISSFMDMRVEIADDIWGKTIGEIFNTRIDIYDRTEETNSNFSIPEEAPVGIFTFFDEWQDSVRRLEMALGHI
ncbi:MAG: hypothetical protein Q9169_008494 [Polycauliona sp. 2 TL-2023]